MFNKKALIDYLRIRIFNQYTFTVYLIVTMYIMSQFINFISFSYGKHQGFYDLVIFIFNDYLAIFYVLGFLFLITIQNVASKTQFDKYILIKFKSRKAWFIINILIIAVGSFIFVTIIILLCLLQSIFNLSLLNKWNEFSLLVAHNPNLFGFYADDSINFFISNYTPLNIVTINSILLFLYLFTLGLIFFVSSIFLRKRIWAFIFSIALNILSINLFILNIKYLDKISFCSNVIVTAKNWISYNFSTDIKLKFIYWLIINFALIILGISKINKIDFKFEETYEKIS